MRITDFKIFQSQVICWCLFVMFSVLAVAWGYVCVIPPKVLTNAGRLILGVIVLAFALHAILFLALAVRARKKRNDQVA